MPIVRLPSEFRSRDGAPVIAAVDTALFHRRYFAECMSCGFCHDACCAHGVDVEEPKVARILAAADQLEPLVGVPRWRWFEPAERDEEFPGGLFRRTAVVDGACVFRARGARGCTLHTWSLATGRDYHETKPLVSTLFPLSFAGGVLCLADELDESDSFVCAGDGATVYRALRGELAWYFGAGLTDVLDTLEGVEAMRTGGAAGDASAGARRLPVIG